MYITNLSINKVVGIVEALKENRKPEEEIWEILNFKVEDAKKIKELEEILE